MRYFLIFLFQLLYFLGLSQQSSYPVFTSGKEGHKSYRIPAIIQLPNGALLAFAEGRVKDSDDFGDINIVLKRSLDKGKTWSALETIVDVDSLQAGNPAPVVDLLDPAFPKGRIFLFFNTGNNHEGEVRKGKGVREVWYKTSVDGGVTWSPPVNITLQTHRPRQPQFNPEYNFPDDWRSYANIPGHATQLLSGSYKGRIYIAANHSKGNPKGYSEDYVAHGFYSDDHGKSFHLSPDVNIPGSNEATATEISGGGLLLNARNQKGDIRARIVAISKNGGQHWDTAYFDRNLPDPICEGSLLTIGHKKAGNILAFCNAADTLDRNHLTLRISYDDGISWKRALVVDETGDGTKKKNFTAYSDIVLLNKRQIGVLFERDNYSQIAFRVMAWK